MLRATFISLWLFKLPLFTQREHGSKSTTSLLPCNTYKAFLLDMYKVFNFSNLFTSFVLSVGFCFFISDQTCHFSSFQKFWLPLIHYFASDFKEILLWVWDSRPPPFFFPNQTLQASSNLATPTQSFNHYLLKPKGVEMMVAKWRRSLLVESINLKSSAPSTVPLTKSRVVPLMMLVEVCNRLPPMGHGRWTIFTNFG